MLGVESTVIVRRLLRKNLLRLAALVKSQVGDVASQLIAPRDQRAREVPVNGQPEGVIYHARQYATQKLRTFVEARVRVTLDEPHAEICINHEIVAENLETAISLLRIQLLFYGVQRLAHDELHVLDEVEAHVDGPPASLLQLVVVVLVDVRLELVKVELVAVLILAVAARVFLHSIVRQVHVGIVAVVQLVLVGRRAQVALLEEENFHILVDEDPDAYVKLAPSYEQWLFDVLLNNEREVLGNLHSLLHEGRRSAPAR